MSIENKKIYLLFHSILLTAVCTKCMDIQELEEKKLLAQQAQACALVLAHVKLVKVPNEASKFNEPCWKLIEKFAMSLKQAENTNNENNEK